MSQNNFKKDCFFLSSHLRVTFFASRLRLASLNHVRHFGVVEREFKLLIMDDMIRIYLNNFWHWYIYKPFLYECTRIRHVAIVARARDDIGVKVYSTYLYDYYTFGARYALSKEIHAAKRWSGSRMMKGAKYVACKVPLHENLNWTPHKTDKSRSHSGIRRRECILLRIRAVCNNA